VKFTNGAIYGGFAPWGSRIDGSLIWQPAFPTHRNIARFNTHALTVLEGHTEEMLDYYPVNGNWEFAHSDFADAHDGMYIAGENIRFHHNRVDHISDDALYLSAMTPRVEPSIHVYQNLFTQCTIPFGWGGRHDTGKGIYIYRNIIDQRLANIYPRPTPGEVPHKVMINSAPIVLHTLLHNSDPTGELRNQMVGPLHFYHNTFIAPTGRGTIWFQDRARSYAHGTLAFTGDSCPRSVFNNIFIYLHDMPPPQPDTLPKPTANVQIDGNLHFSPSGATKDAWCKHLEHTKLWPAPRENSYTQAELAAFHKSDFFTQTKSRYAPGWEANAILADPKFTSHEYPCPTTSAAVNAFKPLPDTPAKSAGVPLPADLEDPLRPAASAKPDIGAIPHDAQPWQVGRPR
jgi:hypothetical protein